MYELKTVCVKGAEERVWQVQGTNSSLFWLKHNTLVKNGMRLKK